MTKMKRLLAIGLALGAAGAITGTASAADLEFQYLGALPNPFGFPVFVEGDWTQADPPVVLADATGDYTDVAANGTDVLYFFLFPFPPATFTDVTFYSTASGGGFEDGTYVSASGPQIYTGPESAPVFTPGVYTLTNGVLTISAVPEPATWAMMLTGLGLVGWAARRRRNVRVAYA